uniref:7TM_GPCR_Srx domain-containing protein n=1 Tax=Heterorhabditis bacteriophora TaxID=37862 RepID=A0A1I7WTG3_HETBA
MFKCNNYNSDELSLSLLCFVSISLFTIKIFLTYFTEFLLSIKICRSYFLQQVIGTITFNMVFNTCFIKITSCCINKTFNRLGVFSVFFRNIYFIDCKSCGLVYAYYIACFLIIISYNFQGTILFLFFLTFYEFLRLTEGGRRDKYSVDILSICPTDTKLIVMVLDHFILLTYHSSTNVVLGSSILPHCSEVWCAKIRIFITFIFMISEDELQLFMI